MEKIKKAIRLTILIFIMVLASFGIGITGAAPVLPRHQEHLAETGKKPAGAEVTEDTGENENADKDR